MEKLSLEVNWNVPPKNGLNQFISPELYAKYSVTYKLTNENIYNYYAKFLNKNEGDTTEDLYNEKEDTEAQKPEYSTSRNKRKEKLKANGFKNRTSSLSVRDHKKYLFLLQRYSTKVVSIDTPEEEKKAIEALMCLHKKVVAEQKEFLEYQKASAKSSLDYKYIHPEASRYVKELIQKKLQSCFLYPRHYVIQQKINLLEEVKIDSSILPNLVCNLLELGKVPRLVLAGLENCSIPCNFVKMCKRFPLSSETTEKHPSKQPISQDSVAKTLADKHSVDMVLTFSSLKHLLMCGSLDSETSWELPITVASFQSGEATDCSTRRVFIDKAIPIGTWFATRKNAIYHKYGAKLHFTHFRPTRGSRKSHNFNQVKSEEKRQSRELVDLQNGFFESENFDHETFGQIKCSEDRSLLDEVFKVKAVESVCKPTNDGSAETDDEKKNDTNSSEKESSPIKSELSKDSSDQPNKESESTIKEANSKVEGNIDTIVESKGFSEVSNSTATYEPDKDVLCKYLQLMNKNAVPQSQSKNGNPNVDEQKTSSGSASEESPKCKRQKTKSEPHPVSPGRRMTRSQTRKLEDAVKQPKQSTNLTAKMEAVKRKQNIDSKCEIVAENSSHQKKGSDENAQVSEDIKPVKKEEAPSNTRKNVEEETSLHGSENSSDSFPRLPSKKVRLLSSDDDTDDNLVIDETIISSDDKQKDLGKVSDIGGIDDTNQTQDDKVPKLNGASLQDEEVNAQSVSNNDSTAQEKHPITTCKTVNGNKVSPDNKKNARSTLDQILHLQEEMLKPKQKSCKTELSSPVEQKMQGSYGPQPGLPTYLEDASQFPSFDPSLNTNVQYSLWNMGQLKVIMRSKLDSRQPNYMPCFIFSKLEYQPKFGAEICTTQELLHQWITLVCHPGSTGLRVRIDARTSKILMTEELTLPNIHNLVAKFSPEKPLCWAIHVLEKLKKLPNGQYLLTYQKKDDIITLYAAADGNKRGDYDLHTAIRQRLVTLDDNGGWEEDCSGTEIPWLPIDPDVMLPSLISRNRIPATFPPANENKTVSKTKKKVSKKKSKKKKSKMSKMKEKLQKI